MYGYEALARRGEKEKQFTGGKKQRAFWEMLCSCSRVSQVP